MTHCTGKVSPHAHLTNVLLGLPSSWVVLVLELLGVGVGEKKLWVWEEWVRWWDGGGTGICFRTWHAIRVLSYRSVLDILNSDFCLYNVQWCIQSTNRPTFYK